MNSYWEGRVTVTPRIEIALTREDWQLYDKPGAAQAARMLSRAAETILNRRGITYSKAQAELDAMLRKYANLGATDTDVRMVATSLLRLRFEE